MKRKVIIGFVVYALLWILTGVVGELQINSCFDQEFVEGSKGAFAEDLKKYPLEKTKRIAKFDVSEPTGGLGENYPALPWKYRSRTLAVAPFLLLDKCAFQTGGLCGWGGIRLHVWFFGLTSWFPVRNYWTS
jgi:hypothetical protein